MPNHRSPFRGSLSSKPSPPNVTGAHELERIIEWCSDDPTFETRCSCGWSSPQLPARSESVLAWEDHRVGLGQQDAAAGYSSRV